MKKKISIALCLLLILISTTVFASTPVKMEIVENNICNIKLKENCKFWIRQKTSYITITS